MSAKKTFDSRNFSEPINEFVGENVELVGHANQVVDRVNELGYAVDQLRNEISPGGNGPAVVVFTGLNGELAQVSIPNGTVELL